ncbi:hypothetical protein BDZ97DRAFT_1917222 [Flammula alnicola]|nr:hypothetical protein BDZ97DRAFT_1917222 [Flammula alnicola]
MSSDYQDLPIHWKGSQEISCGVLSRDWEYKHHRATKSAELQAQKSILPKAEKITPNQNSWPPTAAVMNVAMKSKRKKNTDPYSGGECSGKKACHDKSHYENVAENSGGIAPTVQPTSSNLPTSMDTTLNIAISDVSAAARKILLVVRPPLHPFVAATLPLSVLILPLSLQQSNHTISEGMRSIPKPTLTLLAVIQSENFNPTTVNILDAQFL